MQVTEEGELWALFGVILECKFGGPLCSIEVAGSPTLGGVIDRLWVELQQSPVFQARKPPGGWPSWDAWRRLNPDRPEWKRVIEWIKIDRWDSASIDRKREDIRLLALPYLIPAEHESVLLSLCE